MSNPYVGKFYSNKNKKNIVYDSCYEYVAMVILEEDPRVVKYGRCNFSIPVTITGDYCYSRVPKFYNPDFLVTYCNGQQIILEVKSKGLLKYWDVRQKCAAGFDFTKYTNLKYIIWTEKEMGLPSSKKTLHNWFYQHSGKKNPNHKGVVYQEMEVGSLVKSKNGIPGKIAEIDLNGQVVVQWTNAMTKVDYNWVEKRLLPKEEALKWISDQVGKENSNG